MAQAAEAEHDPISGGAPYYPPSWTGLRGSHPGAFERAHELAREGREDWGGVTETNEEYDLVVVGAGASGLAAAYAFQRANEGAKTLILDNHDDFGGHARRNEFKSGGRVRMTYGGSQGFDNIANWPQEMWDLLEELGIDMDAFETTYYDQTYHKRHGMNGGVFLDAATWGKDYMIPADMGDMAPVIPGLGAGSNDFKALLSGAPIADEAKAELVKLYKEEGGNRIATTINDADVDTDKLPYEKFLKDYWGVGHPDTFKFLRKLPTDENGVGADAISLSEAVSGSMPGCVTLGKQLGLIMEAEPGDPGYCHHFPDGNAGFCRTIVRAMIPAVSEADTPEDLITEDFNYGALDAAENKVRLRLSSTVIEVKHNGPVDSADKVTITYILDGKARRVHAKNVVLACWNMIIPHICRDLPDDQKEALASNVKIPYVFATVLVKNWRAIKKSGIGGAYCPTAFFHLFQTAYPVNMGAYKATENPDEPMPITLIRVPVPEDRDIAPRDQFRQGRMEILSQTFEDFEAEIHSQLNGMFGAHGFNAAKDIEAITLNRWPHGYAYTYFSLWDNGDTIESGPHQKARKRFGRIAIANSDAGANSWLDVGIVQGLRAVKELAEA
ncbi:MAG: hypothetical protein A2516_06155 [Alphaproteobacteria bacterium RIFOXYD12_FULL_60_8]|nr:MAG: hypothetical protein A2516_06155 [Alphaproteobacteria bacterium RIFOXYD12_FULL_60_8]